ncbi:hypothetical protein C8Q77DRAFT_827433 [Trametes polyzona]|nr:hypothetical protein C8Q77DRAFT_827433 [Trametes polyzona]
MFLGAILCHHRWRFGSRVSCGVRGVLRVKTASTGSTRPAGTCCSVGKSRSRRSQGEWLERQRPDRGDAPSCGVRPSKEGMQQPSQPKDLPKRWMTTI